MNMWTTDRPMTSLQQWTAHRTTPRTVFFLSCIKRMKHIKFPTDSYLHMSENVRCYITKFKSWVKFGLDIITDLWPQAYPCSLCRNRIYALISHGLQSHVAACLALSLVTEFFLDHNSDVNILCLNGLNLTALNNVNTVRYAKTVKKTVKTVKIVKSVKSVKIC